MNSINSLLSLLTFVTLILLLATWLESLAYFRFPFSSKNNYAGGFALLPGHRSAVLTGPVVWCCPCLEFEMFHDITISSLPNELLSIRAFF